MSVVASSIQIWISSCGRNKQTARDEDGGCGVVSPVFDFVLFCTFLRGFDHRWSKAWTWKYQWGVGVFFLLVGFFCSSSIFFFPSGRLSDKEPSFVCASVLLIPLIWNTVITSPHLLLLPYALKERIHRSCSLCQCCLWWGLEQGGAMGRHSWKIWVIIGEAKGSESVQALAFFPKPKSTLPEKEANLSSSFPAQSVYTPSELHKFWSLVQSVLLGWGMRSISPLKIPALGIEDREHALWTTIVVRVIVWHLNRHCPLWAEVRTKTFRTRTWTCSPPENAWVARDKVCGVPVSSLFWTLVCCWRSVCLKMMYQKVSVCLGWILHFPS